MNGSVDVIIPCYRYAHLLRDCVASVLDQEDVRVRALIIDDCSPDDTQAVAREIIESDSRVEYRRHRKNLGHIDTYNEGIDWLRADYALLLSADDMLAPGALRRACALMDAHPQVVLTYGNVVKSDRFVRSRYQNEPETARVLSGREFLEIICAEGDNIVPTPTAIVRTKVQTQIGGYRHHLPHAGDLEMWLRFAAHGSVCIFDAVQGFYRVHANNMSHQYAGVADLRQQLEAFESVFREHGDRIDDVDSLSTQLRHRIAERAFWSASKGFDRGETRHFDENIAFALEIWPGLRSTTMWWRFQCKRAVGKKVWSVVRPMFNRVRRRPQLAGQA